MSTTADSLPLTETVTPAESAELADAIAGAYRAKTPVYPIGGGTSLDYGLPPQEPGIGLSLEKLNRVIDYPADDMTITVEAGITMAALADELRAHRQRLPVDAPNAEHATLGGVLATATSGPRRFGQGTVRDYVIGISAVDGRGIPFKGGGRVVKNVAGYDFCKLLTGSLGTLGVVTQITLKVKPVPEASALVMCSAEDLEDAERLLAGLVDSATTPVAIELLLGPSWQVDPASAGLSDGAACVVVGLEGTRAEVDWMIDRLGSEWQSAGMKPVPVTDPAQVDRWWSRLTEFPVDGAGGGESPLVVKANLVPSATVPFCQLLLEVDANCSIQAHAGSGIIIARLAEVDPDEMSRLLITRLQPQALSGGGNVTILSCAGGDLSRQSYWGGVQEDREVMTAVKQQFDPAGILNRGRFLF